MKYGLHEFCWCDIQPTRILWVWQFDSNSVYFPLERLERNRWGCENDQGGEERAAACVAGPVSAHLPAASQGLWPPSRSGFPDIIKAAEAHVTLKAGVRQPQKVREGLLSMGCSKFSTGREKVIEVSFTGLVGRWLSQLIVSAIGHVPTLVLS